jgi:hypothetical protein
MAVTGVATDLCGGRTFHSYLNVNAAIHMSIGQMSILEKFVLKKQRSEA